MEVLADSICYYCGCYLSLDLRVQLGAVAHKDLTLDNYELDDWELSPTFPGVSPVGVSCL